MDSYDAKIFLPSFWGKGEKGYQSFKKSFELNGVGSLRKGNEINLALDDKYLIRVCIFPEWIPEELSDGKIFSEKFFSPVKDIIISDIKGAIGLIENKIIPFVKEKDIRNRFLHGTIIEYERYEDTLMVYNLATAPVEGDNHRSSSESMLTLKGLDKKLVSEEFHDIWEMAQNLDRKGSKDDSCPFIKGDSLKEAFERFLELPDMEKRLKGLI